MSVETRIATSPITTAFTAAMATLAAAAVHLLVAMIVAIGIIAWSLRQ